MIDTSDSKRFVMGYCPIYSRITMRYCISMRSLIVVDNLQHNNDIPMKAIIIMKTRLGPKSES